MHMKEVHHSLVNRFREASDELNDLVKVENQPPNTSSNIVVAEYYEKMASTLRKTDELLRKLVKAERFLGIETSPHKDVIQLIK